MLITFKSAASADVIMFGDAAKALLQTLEKNPDASQGIITVEQLPAAIERLDRAIAQDKARHEHAAREPADDDAPQSGMAAPVNFTQRAWPLLEMLQLAQAEAKPVTWGV
ncbi:MAG: DUF1840 domain-containing protein [Rhodocyclaceae bacterium]|nr:DUF1840 domain-containing protein [Rhodocyclaceae bacterium]